MSEDEVDNYFDNFDNFFDTDSERAYVSNKILLHGTYCHYIYKVNFSVSACIPLCIYLSGKH